MRSAHVQQTKGQQSKKPSAPAKGRPWLNNMTLAAGRMAASSQCDISSGTWHWGHHTTTLALQQTTFLRSRGDTRRHIIPHDHDRSLPGVNN
jgi:hypothetical protein